MTSEESEKPAQKSLPSSRMKMDKQIDVLKSFVVYFTKNNAPASYKEIAPLTNSTPTTVSGTLKFWKDSGMLQGDTGKYQPTPTLTEFARKYNWGDQEGAWELFRTALSGTWYVSNTIMLLSIKKQVSADEIINSLGSASGNASREGEVGEALVTLFSLLEMAKIVIKGPDEMYTINPGFEKKVGRKLVADETKSLTQVRINGELYAIETDQLKKFILENGRSLNATQQELQ